MKPAEMYCILNALVRPETYFIEPLNRPWLDPSLEYEVSVIDLPKSTRPKRYWSDSGTAYRTWSGLMFWM